MRHYGSKGIKQERFDEAKLSTAHCANELADDIQFENKRVNVDSAKKIAVMQHMDYDQFHQMVLGANLKPSPAGQTPNIYVPTGTLKNINHTATF